MTVSSDFVNMPFVTFVITCPFCRDQFPLPAVAVTPVLEMEPGGNWLSVQVAAIPRVPHTCAGMRP